MEVIAWFPEVPFAVAPMVCVPGADFLVFHLYDNEEPVAVLTIAPSRYRLRLAIPIESAEHCRRALHMLYATW